MKIITLKASLHPAPRRIAKGGQFLVTVFAKKRSKVDYILQIIRVGVLYFRTFYGYVFALYLNGIIKYKVDNIII